MNVLLCLSHPARLAWQPAWRGVWPLVSLRTFEGVTRPKVDSWLVKSVGVWFLPSV